MRLRGDRWVMAVYLRWKPAGWLRGFGSRTYMQAVPKEAVAVLRPYLDATPDGDGQSDVRYWLEVRGTLKGAVTLGWPEPTYERGQRPFAE